MLPRIECGLHHAPLGCGPDDQDAFDRFGFEQQLQRRMVERGVAVLEQDMVALRVVARFAFAVAKPVSRNTTGSGYPFAVPNAAAP